MVENTHETHQGQKVLASPPEGFDAYNSHHPPQGEHVEHEHIHIPPPSYWPVLLSLAITIMLAGFIIGPVVVILGIVFTLGSIVAWSIEGSEAKPNALTQVIVIGHGDAEELLTEGARVLTSDGQVVGRISRASEHSPLVRAGWIPTRHGYLARRFIDHIENGLIVLNITEHEVRQRANVNTTPAGPGAGLIALPPSNPSANIASARIPAHTESEG